MTIYQSIIESLEWRVWALIITVSVLLLNHLPLGQVGLITLETQLALFAGQAVWIYWKAR